jgi:hypothetical protein
VAIDDKPTVTQLGVDVDRLTWQRSGAGDEAIEVAFVEALGRPWVLTRVSGDPGDPVLVYSEREWECFVRAEPKDGEFDDAGG